LALLPAGNDQGSGHADYEQVCGMPFVPAKHI
jgi:hypothetical protein